MFSAPGGDFKDAVKALVGELNRIGQSGSREERRAKLIAFLRQHPKDFRHWEELPDGISVTCGAFPVMAFDNRAPELPVEADDAGR